MTQETRKAEDLLHYWTTLNHAVKANLETGRVGHPVFVRCTAATAESAETLTDHLAEMISHVNGWLAASVSRVYALGPHTQGHIATSLEYHSGSTALLTVAIDHTRPQIDLILLGSSGAIYHREQIHPSRDGSLTPKATKTVDTIMNAVTQSLATGKPVTL